MKNLLLLPLLCLLTLTLSAQPRGARCNYAELLRQGKAEAQKGAYPAALLKFNSARRCDPRKGEEVDAAIDTVFQKIEKQRKEAEEAKKQAQQEKNKAENALRELQKTTEEVVRFILKDAEKLILNLDYAGAWIKLRAAGRLKALTRKVALALLEPAFWHAEAGHYALAAAMLDTITGPGLLNNSSVKTLLRQLPQLDSTAKRLHLRKCMLMLDKATYTFYQQRYYPVMVRVPGDEFMMGDVMGDDDSLTHPVRLSDFEIASTETTVWQWSIFCATTGRNIAERYLEKNWNEPGDNPVVNISWYDAVEYANWCSAMQGLSAAYEIDKTQKDTLNQNRSDNFKWQVAFQRNAPGFRLPTEAEWEYAARGGGKKVRFGNGKDTARTREINFSGSANDEDYAFYVKGGSRGRTSAVTSLNSPNALGLHDMSGNVWEWCWDWYETYLSKPTADYAGPESGSYRVLRGGSWRDFAEYCRFADRVSNPYRGYDYYGFRLARTP